MPRHGQIPTIIDQDSVRLSRECYGVRKPHMTGRYCRRFEHNFWGTVKLSGECLVMRTVEAWALQDAETASYVENCR